MEHEIVQMLSCMLLPNNLEITLLESLEIKSDIPSQKIQTILYALNFFYNYLNYFKWVALFVNLFYHLGFFD